MFSRTFKEGDTRLPRPQNLNKMLDVASRLSTGFPILRVDLYEVDGKVYFGELTFSSLGGFMDYLTPEILQKMGEIVNLGIE